MEQAKLSNEQLAEAIAEGKVRMVPVSRNLRDEIAIAAMVVIVERAMQSQTVPSRSEIATESYKLADAMLKAREAA
jgi:hypothetical protein